MSQNQSETKPATQPNFGMALMLSGLPTEGALTALYAGGQSYMHAWASSLMPNKAAVN